MSALSLTPPAPEAAGEGALAALVHARLAKVTGAARRCRDRADGDAIHDLRVGIRRLESVLDVWRDALRPKARVRARRRLRRLRRDAGPAREREVCAALLAARCEDAGDAERPALAALLDELGPPLDRERAHVAERVSEAWMVRTARRLERALQTEGLPERESSAASRAAARLERRRHAALESLAEAQSSLDDTVLHAARIAVKKWRYAEEAYAAIAGAPAAPARGLRALQRRLGAAHDAAVLRDLLLARARRWAARDDARAPALAAVAATVEHERRAALAGLHTKAAKRTKH